jgi:hypothetical protein
MLLATYHKQTRNIDANISRWMLHGRRFATLNTLFRNIVKVFRNIPARRPRSMADRCLHPNRAAQHSSDASASIGRPSARGTEKKEKRKAKVTADYRVDPSATSGVVGLAHLAAGRLRERARCAALLLCSTRKLARPAREQPANPDQ